MTTHMDHGIKRRAARILVDSLASDDGGIRARARRALVAIGPPATPVLAALLGDENKRVRWESAKALAEIADPASALALVESLEDPDGEIRWLAAEGLIGMGGPGLIQVLRRLTSLPHSSWLREGAHHVLHELARGPDGPALESVLSALEDPTSHVQVRLAAERALASLAEDEGESV